jgi:hypothetical protein
LLAAGRWPNHRQLDEVASLNFDAGGDKLRPDNRHFYRFAGAGFTPDLRFKSQQPEANN